MKITKVDIPKSERNGLEHIKMDRLGPVVLITGKNGSGKTRILNEIKTNLERKPVKKDIDKAKDDIFMLETNRNLNNADIEAQKQYCDSLDENNRAQVTKNINELEASVEIIETKLYKAKKVIEWDYIETSGTGSGYDEAVQFVPKNLQLTDSNSFSKKEMHSRAEQMNWVGVKPLAEGTFAKIQVIQNRWFEATHPDSQSSEAMKKQAIEDCEGLEELIKLFFDTSIGRTPDGDATLFGFPLGKTALSDGQKVLLQFCLAIYSQETKLKDLILILDEPENHLHPSVIIEVLDRIKECNANGQIWVATHSIPILAHFDPSYIWYVENNKISYAGKIPEKVLNGLLGDEDEIGRLQDFISLPAQFASSLYAFECLFEPGSVATGSNDPQTNQIRTILKKLSEDRKIRVLDYGAGKGRLISNIYDSYQNKESLNEELDYSAFDSSSQDKGTCENAITQAYGSNEKRYFNEMQDLLVHGMESFQVVVMCNVLHEIDPTDWLTLFGKDGEITSLLADNGGLLLVEDHEIPVGEKAYQKGFLVLDTLQLKILFNIDNNDEGFVDDARGDGRLKAHYIPKRCLQTIDAESRLKAIEYMSKHAQDKIKKIRKEEQNYKNGRLHGFWVQQFANAQLNLAELAPSQ